MVFVDFGNTAFFDARMKMDEKYLLRDKLKKFSVVNGVIEVGDKLEKRGIADYSLHKCEVIVNSLNIEGKFINSGSFSGFIAHKTGSQKDKIQKAIKEHISVFNQRPKNYFNNNQKE